MRVRFTSTLVLATSLLTACGVAARPTEALSECADGVDNDGDGDADCLDTDCARAAACCDDADGDGVCDTVDICPDGDDRADLDGDLAPDACDPCPADFGDDSDGDGVCDSEDTCPSDDDALDQDGDDVPDACDPCPLDDPDDADGDGVCTSSDVCPGGDDAVDGDGDSVPDACDPCPLDDPDDADGDGVCASSDVCPDGDDAVDGDGDGVPDACDLCPLDDPDDSDMDGVCDTDDACPGYDDGEDEDADGIPDACEPEDTVDTADTADTGGPNAPKPLRPTNYWVTVQLGIDAMGGTSDFVFEGQTFSSGLFITIDDDDHSDRNECSIAYLIPTSSPGDTDTDSDDAELGAWVAQEGLVAGLRVFGDAANLSPLLRYNGDPCDLVPAWRHINADPSAFFFQDPDGDPNTMLVGVGDALSPRFEARLHRVPGARTDRATSSYVRLPTRYVLPGQPWTRHLELTTEAFVVDASMVMQKDRGGTQLDYLDPSSFDAGGGRLATGVYLMHARAKIGMGGHPSASINGDTYRDHDTATAFDLVTLTDVTLNYQIDITTSGRLATALASLYPAQLAPCSASYVGTGTLVSKTWRNSAKFVGTWQPSTDTCVPFPSSFIYSDLALQSFSTLWVWSADPPSAFHTLTFSPSRDRLRFWVTHADERSHDLRWDPMAHQQQGLRLAAPHGFDVSTLSATYVEDSTAEVYTGIVGSFHTTLEVQFNGAADTDDTDLP